MITTYFGDCLEEMYNICERSVHMVLCDLPHGKTQADWDVEIDLVQLWEHYRRVLQPDGTVVLFGNQPYTSKLVMSNLPWFRYEWVIEKSKATGWLNAKKRPMKSHEDVLVFSPKTPRYYPQMREGEPYNKGLVKEQSDRDIYGDYNRVVVKSEDGSRYPRSVLYCKTPESERTKYPLLHKTQKSVSLLRYFIRTYTNPGEKVLDNAMGSGATGIACIEEGRSFIGIEKDPDFQEKANRWLLEMSA